MKDGGPVFPEAFVYDESVGMAGGFVTATEAGAAPGMTLRDWFAGQAVVAIPHIECGSDLDNDELAEAAYRIADKMLAAREEGGGDHA